VSKTRPRRRKAAGFATAAILLLAIGAYAAYRQFTPYLAGSGCQAVASGQGISLDAEQASIAATIAGVAVRDKLPRGAVTVAYATAMQESHLHDLNYGDQDSVGVFQQRPSQGWGTTQQLEDPVYATKAFFTALTQVHGYLQMPVYQAAQAVQRSADGTAYMQYEQMAAGLSGAFTGQSPRAVWCWYAPDAPRAPDLGGAGRALSRTFGSVKVDSRGKGAAASGPAAPSSAAPAGSQPVAAVPVRHPPTGWAVASWLVTHAKAYGISDVRYAGYQWSASAGDHGWIRDATAPLSRVELS
jgi:hypothetical protein